MRLLREALMWTLLFALWVRQQTGADEKLSRDLGRVILHAWAAGLVLGALAVSAILGAITWAL